MPRKGKELEKLVKTLEQIIAGTGIEIKSPDYIFGIKSKRKREVDVSLKAKIGSINFLVVFECRDRKGAQDVTWIEQLAKKKEDIQASEVIAVSSVGFSETAKELAKIEGIELRSLESLSADSVFKWFNFVFQACRVRPYHIDFGVRNEDFDYVNEIISNFEFHKKNVFNPKTGETVSFHDIWTDYFTKNTNSFNVVSEGESKNITVRINFEPDEYLQVPVSKGMLNINAIQFLVEVTLKKPEPRNLKEYKKINGEVIAETVSFSIDEDNIEFQFINIKPNSL